MTPAATDVTARRRRSTPRAIAAPDPF